MTPKVPETEDRKIEFGEHAAATQTGQPQTAAPSQEGRAAGSAPAVAHEITDEQGRPMTYWGGLKKPAPAAAPTPEPTGTLIEEIEKLAETTAEKAWRLEREGKNDADPGPAGGMPEELDDMIERLKDRAINVGQRPDKIYAQAASLLEVLRTHAEQLQARVRELENQLENAKNKVAGCSSAAIGYWREGDSLYSGYECVAIHDVAQLYQRFEQAEAKLREAITALAALIPVAELRINEWNDIQRKRLMKAREIIALAHGRGESRDDNNVNMPFSGSIERKE